MIIKCKGEIMQKSGRTPLIRARKLEKVLNIGEIFLKLEGDNPSGHKYDRITEVLVKDAINKGFSQILVDGSKSYIESVMFFANLKQLEVKVPVLKKGKWKIAHLDETTLMDLQDSKDTFSRSQLKDIAKESNMYLTCEWDINSTISHLVLEDMTKECLKRMNYKVDTITLQLGYGYTLSSIYSGLMKSWIKEELSQLPQLLCDSNLSCHDMLSQYAKKIIMETHVKMIDVDDVDLENATSMLREYENVIISKKEAYAMAVLIKKAKNGLLSCGKHLVILNDAKSEVEVCQIKNFEEKTKNEFIEMIEAWLSPYNDSVAEELDAIEKAMKEGYLLIANRDGEEQGICIIVNMGFEHFIPTYHLAYIGVKSGNEGRGVASEMLKRAIELTDGKLSLHVDIDNKRAKNLYYKMGFKHVYDRLLFKGLSD